VVVLTDVFGKLIDRSDVFPGFLNSHIGRRIVVSGSVESQPLAGVIVALLVAFILASVIVCPLDAGWKRVLRKGNPPDHRS
jgi:hypothetical protein